MPALSGAASRARDGGQRVGCSCCSCLWSERRGREKPPRLMGETWSLSPRQQPLSWDGRTILTALGTFCN